MRTPPQKAGIYVSSASRTASFVGGEAMDGDVFRMFFVFSMIFLYVFHVFFPTVFVFVSAGSALQALGAAERAGDEAPKPA